MLKKIARISLILIAILLILVFVTDYWVSKSVKENLYTNVYETPANKVGLLLGTSKYTVGGHVNLYYKYRINAAVELFKSGKINFILVSGDNGTMQYDEPNTMKKDLIAAGIPEDKIYLDYAGFRTLDSIMRCKYIFGQSSITVISQPFHNERALFIAHRKNIKAVGFNAKEVPNGYSVKVRIREKFARVKMMIDLLFDKQPKYYGTKIEIE